MVPMPVRVNPPPADTGEIISPGCASFEITTPLNGARTTMSVRFGLLQIDLALGDADLLRARSAIRAFSESTFDCASSSSALPTTPSFRSCCAAAEREFRLLEPRLILRGRLARRGQLRLRQRQRGARLGVVEVRQDLPLLAPAGLLRSGRPTTLPVTFDETVARRRATT